MIIRPKLNLYLALGVLAGLPLLTRPARAEEGQVDLKPVTPEVKALREAVQRVEQALAEKKRHNATLPDQKRGLRDDTQALIANSGFSPSLDLETQARKLMKGAYHVDPVPNSGDAQSVQVVGHGEAKECAEQLSVLAKKLPGTVVNRIELGEARWIVILSRPPTTTADYKPPMLPEVTLPPGDPDSGPEAQELRQRFSNRWSELERESKAEKVVLEYEARRASFQKAVEATKSDYNRIRQVPAEVLAIFSGGDQVVTSGSVEFDADSIRVTGLEPNSARDLGPLKAALAKSYDVKEATRDAGKLKVVLTKKAVAAAR